MKQDRVPYTKPIPVKLPPELLARIDAVSKRMGEPRSTVMRIAMRLGLDSLEKAFEGDTPKLSSLVYPEHRPHHSVMNEGEDENGGGAKKTKPKKAA